MTDREEMKMDCLPWWGSLCCWGRRWRCRRRRGPRTCLRRPLVPGERASARLLFSALIEIKSTTGSAQIHRYHFEDISLINVWRVRFADVHCMERIAMWALTVLAGCLFGFLLAFSGGCLRFLWAHEVGFSFSFLFAMMEIKCRRSAPVLIAYLLRRKEGLLKMPNN